MRILVERKRRVLVRGVSGPVGISEDEDIEYSRNYTISGS